MHIRDCFRLLLIAVGIAPGLALSAGAGADSLPTEHDYLEDVPVVLSVSRLPQRPEEIPGAVTIIDRQMITASGARDVADLLRLVPGFRVSDSFESNAPQGSYHLSMQDYSNRLQVLIDGRSVYSSYLQGSTGPGLETVALEDIERIEVYRGSNSAAYGARAMLGSINIVTRDPLDTFGTLVKVTAGDRGIQDNLVRLGWGDDVHRFRLTGDTRNDAGLQGASGPVSVRRVNLRGDVQASSDDTVELRAGQTTQEAGVGFAGSDNAGNAPRTRGIETGFLQVNWRRSLGADEDLSLQVSRTQEDVHDNFSYTPLPGLTVDFGGWSTNDSVTLQHTLRSSSTLRWVWGAELRRETVGSQPLYGTSTPYITDFARLFGNVEWRLQPNLLLNAGALAEYSSDAGNNMAPRVMLNWEVAPGHTLRAGYSDAFRPPSTYELHANVRYYYNGTPADATDVATGGARSERVETRELGYLLQWPEAGMDLDIRLFDEEAHDFIMSRSYSLPGSGNDNLANDFVNLGTFHVIGQELQLNWRPWPGGRIHYTYTLLDDSQTQGSGQVSPYGTQGLMFMQAFPAGWSASLSYFQADASHFPGIDQDAPAYRRTDLRVARALRLGGHPAEAAFVLQNWGGSYPDFFPSQMFVQQAFVTLRLEY